MKNRVRLLICTATVCAGCTTADRHTVPRSTNRAWRKYQSYYALQEIVDTRFYPGFHVELTRQNVIEILGDDKRVDYPGVRTNTLAFHAYRKNGTAVDLLVTFNTNGLVDGVEWVDPSRFPWAAVDLPHAPELPATHGPTNALTLCVALDDFGGKFINYHRISAPQLVSVLSNRFERYGEFPVVIGADTKCSFSDVWAVAAQCRAQGPDRRSESILEGRHPEHCDNGEALEEQTRGHLIGSGKILRQSDGAAFALEADGAA